MGAAGLEQAEAEAGGFTDEGKTASASLNQQDPTSINLKINALNSIKSWEILKKIDENNLLLSH